MNIGLIKWFDIEKGFGVAKSLPDSDVFIHKNGFIAFPDNILTGTALLYEVKTHKGKPEGAKIRVPSNYNDWEFIMELLEKQESVSIEVEVLVSRRYGSSYRKKESKSFSVISYAAPQLLRSKSREETISFVCKYFTEVIKRRKPGLFYQYANFVKSTINGFKQPGGNTVLEAIFSCFNENKDNNMLFQAWVNNDPGILNLTSFTGDELSVDFFRENVGSIKTEYLVKIQKLDNANDVLQNLFSLKLEVFNKEQSLDEYLLLTKIIDSIPSDDLKAQCNLKLATSQSLIPHITEDKTLYDFVVRFSSKEIIEAVLRKWQHQSKGLTVSLLHNVISAGYPITDISQHFFDKYLESSSIAEFRALLNINPEPGLISKFIETVDLTKEDHISKVGGIAYSNVQQIQFEDKISVLLEKKEFADSHNGQRLIYKLISELGQDTFSLETLAKIEELIFSNFSENLMKNFADKKISHSYELNKATSIFKECKDRLFSDALIQKQSDIFENFILENSDAQIIVEAWEEGFVPSFIPYLLSNANTFSTNDLDTVLRNSKLESTLIRSIIDQRIEKGSDEVWILRTAHEYLEINDFNAIDKIIYDRSIDDVYFNLWKKGLGKIFPVPFIKNMISVNSNDVYLVHNWVKEKLCAIDHVAAVLIDLLDEYNEIVDRKSFYINSRCIKCLLDLDPKFTDVISKRKNNFSDLILWFLELKEDFDIKLLQRKFIYFSPSDQVKIIKRLFYLKHQGKILFTIVELEEIVRADLDLFLLNEKFNDDFVLDISTSLIIELIKNYQSQGRFLADSDLLKIVLHDIGKERRKKFKIEGYFENCEGRSEAKWNWNNTRGKVYKTTNGNDYYFIIEFDYDSDLVNAVKNIPGRKFDSNSKNWTAPSSSEQAVMSFIRSYRFFYDAGSNNFSNNPHLAVFERKEIPNGIKFCEGRIANKKDARLDKAFWWCAGQPCLQHCETEHLTPESDYNKLTLLDLLKIFEINVDENNSYGFIPNGKYYQLISQINRFNRLLERLYCQGCDEILFPVESSNFAAYTVVRFSCNNRSCVEHSKVVYLNHCLDGKCNFIIDSRISKKCDNGLYICNGCGGCCSHDMLNRRLNNLRTNGGVIHQQLIEAVEGKKGHQEKNEYFCYKCSGIMTEVIDDIHGKPNYFMCLECKVEYHPTSILTRPHLHLRRQNYPTSKLSEILRNGNNPSSSGGFNDFDF